MLLLTNHKAMNKKIGLYLDNTTGRVLAIIGENKNFLQRNISYIERTVEEIEPFLQQEGSRLFYNQDNFEGMEVSDFIRTK